MLKRLLIAVLALSFILAFTGTAFSDVNPYDLEIGTPITKVDVNAPKYGHDVSVGPIKPASRPVGDRLTPLPAGVTIPGPPLGSYCQDLWYDDGVILGFWGIDASGPGTDDFFNVRYTTEENYECTLSVMWVQIYGPAMTGTPDMMVYLWDDDGFGNPGTALDSMFVPFASMPTVYTWMTFDWSTSPNAPAGGWVFGTPQGTEDYHLGIQARGIPGTDAIAMMVALGAAPDTDRTIFWDGVAGAWGTMLGVFGTDYMMVQSSESCCGELPFTDCYSQGYHVSFTSLFAIPDPVWGNTDYSQRFDVGGPETLVSVDVYLYDDGSGAFGLDDILVNVYADSSGWPTSSNVLWTTTLVAGSYVVGWNNIPIGEVMDNNFHVGFSSSGVLGTGYQALVGDDGTNGQGRGFTSYDGVNWIPILNDWGTDKNVWMWANMCRDAFADCEIQSWTGGAASFWTITSTIQQVAAGVRMTAEGINCQINEVSFALYDPGDPLAYLEDSKISIYTDAGGVPGTEIASILVPVADYSFFPALQTVDFHALDIYITGDYHVVVEALGTGTIYTLTDGGGANENRSSFDLSPVGAPWLTMFDAFGTDYGTVAYSSHCCIPLDVPVVEPRVCLPGTDNGWATFQGDQGRTGASELPVGDAWCNLNLNWSYDGPNQVLFTAPVIYGDQAVCAFSDQYVVLNIVTGMPAYAPIDASLGDGFLVGTAISSAPTVANIGGVDMMFFAGGSRLSTGAIDFNTGALIWQNTLLSGAGIWGKTSFTSFTVLNVAGTDVVFHTTDAGHVVALEAATGALYAGWTAGNPINLGSHAYASGATDGTSLFYSTQDAASEGDIFSIDAATGLINWTLSAAGGLEGPTKTGYVYPEGFRSGVAFKDGTIYAISWANDGGTSAFPLDGFFYQIDAATGNHNVPPTATNRSIYASPIVGGDFVYSPSMSQYATPTGGGGNLVAFRKYTGIIEWSTQTPDDARYYNSGIISCEPDDLGPAPDLIFVFNQFGFFECYNSVTGEQIFSRRVDHGGTTDERGMGGAMAMTTTDGLHMLFADQSGELYDFKLGAADRPRLEMQTFTIKTAIDFGADPALVLPLGPIIVNTGCADLNITAVTVDENPVSGSSFPLFSSTHIVAEEIMERANAISDFMQREAFLSKFTMIADAHVTSVLDVNSSDRELKSSSFSAGIPAWFVSLDSPASGDIIFPGDTTSLQITINQPMISRGKQSVYIAFTSDDPDYFLNADAIAGGFLPEVKLTIIGGCLVDTTTLSFGMGGANTQLVTNSGRLGTGDWDPHGFDIDGDVSSYYQGSYIYGVEQFRLAVNTQDWLAGGALDGEDGGWFGLQADPNYCDNTCKPALTAAVAVGAISIDGVTYDPIAADMVCKTYVDSVTSVPGNVVDTTAVGSFGWSDFENLNFDDTLTMGLMVNSRTIGVTDLPELANMTLEIMDINERNGIDSVTGWYFGQITDYDVGGDAAAMDRTISTAWAYNPGGGNAWGSIKIPFGCGTLGAGQDFDYEPLRAIKDLGGAMALFWQDGAAGTQGGAYFDSAYQWLSLPAGSIAPAQATSDFEMHTTYAGHDFEPGGTYSLAVANFALFGLADNATAGAEMTDLANTVNKWAGFGRGDVNNDGGINLADIIYLAGNVNNAGPGAIPFAHLGDVNADGAIDAADIAYLVDYYFNCGPCPMGDWMF